MLPSVTGASHDMTQLPGDNGPFVICNMSVACYRCHPIMMRPHRLHTSKGAPETIGQPQRTFNIVSSTDGDLSRASTLDRVSSVPDLVPLISSSQAPRRSFASLASGLAGSSSFQLHSRSRSGRLLWCSTFAL